MLIVVVFALLLVIIALLWQNHSLRSETFQARKGERMKQAFLENISHEIKVPLKVVNTLAEVVSKEDLYLSKNEKRNISDQMKYNANLINTLLEEVMAFSDQSAGGHHFTIESFSPNALCRRCLEANMHSIYHRQSVPLNFKRELNDEFFVKSDRHIVELIVSKLIINACKFTDNGSITVGCNTSEHAEQLTIYVSDTGKGIPQNRKSNLFSFFDDPDDMRDEAELDLSICQRLAQKLGGDVRLDELYQKGTRIQLILPLKK